MGIWIYWVPLAIVGVIAWIVTATGISSKCTACNRWWAMKETDRREIGREPGIKKVKRKEVKKDAAGKVLEEVEREETVAVERVSYDTCVECKYCGDKASKMVVQERELQVVANATSPGAVCPMQGSFAPERCSLCTGTGKRVTEICPGCHGVGKVSVVQPSRMCEVCQGWGRKFADLCNACGGSGWSNVVRT
jgi:DnaJ-class molecular chaperone